MGSKLGGKFFGSVKTCKNLFFCSVNGCRSTWMPIHTDLLLKNLRIVDDKIFYEANLATPTNSFRDKLDPIERCNDLHKRVRRTKIFQGI